MNAEGIREIAKMQCSIDGYSYFLNKHDKKGTATLLPLFWRISY